MSSKEMQKPYSIFSFPKPFSLEKTPYKEMDFSETVKLTCSSPSALICGFKMCKVIILGDINVGKTSIVNRFCHQVFNLNYKGTIGVDFEIEEFTILNVAFHMHIWDTAGQERFRSIAAAYYRSTHVIVAVFDLTNIESLHHSLDWVNEASKENAVTPLKFLVGTKKDLLINSVYSKVEEEASKIAEFIGAEYWAVSSKTGEGIKDLFFRIAALSFEQIIKFEMESTVHNIRFKLGQTLIC